MCGGAPRRSRAASLPPTEEGRFVNQAKRMRPAHNGPLAPFVPQHAKLLGNLAWGLNPWSEHGVGRRSLKSLPADRPGGRCAARGAIPRDDAGAARALGARARLAA